MSKSSHAKLIAVSGGQFIGVLNTKDGRKLYTEKGNKTEVFMAFTKMPEYQKNPPLLTLQ